MAGVAKHGDPLGLSDSANLKVDMIVVGSSAVSRNGARLGKGEVRAILAYQAGLSSWSMNIWLAVVCMHTPGLHAHTELPSPGQLQHA
jgi:hypothetical protein